MKHELTVYCFPMATSVPFSSEKRCSLSDLPSWLLEECTTEVTGYLLYKTRRVESQSYEYSGPGMTDVPSTLAKFAFHQLHGDCTLLNQVFPFDKK